MKVVEFLLKNINSKEKAYKIKSNEIKLIKYLIIGPTLVRI